MQGVAAAPDFSRISRLSPRRGQPSIKLFFAEGDSAPISTTYSAHLEAARDAGVVTMVHCEDEAIVAAATAGV